ncbi:MAG: T9SS type A sorting domain-containing protein [Bacteroidota bacterium]|nr:T9SS type A sorting domain-containing protein [Bacteroidota bacterium]
MKANIRNKVIGTMIAVLIVLSFCSFGQSPCTADAGQNVTICSHDKAKFTASAGDKYLWSTGDTTQSISVTPYYSTIYTVTITTGGCTASNQVSAYALPIPVADAGPDQTICNGMSTHLNPVSTGVDYEWNFMTNVSNPIVSPSVTTTYSLTVTANGCTASDYLVITVNTIPTVDAGPYQTICMGESVTLTASGGDNYTWSTGQNASTFTVTPNVATTFVVTAYKNGCTERDEVVVFVKPNPVDAGPNQTICLGSSITLTASGSGTFYWSNGQTTKYNTVSPTIRTTYTVTETLNGCTGTDAVVIETLPLPKASAGNDVTINPGESVTLTGSGGSNYLWSNGSNNKTTVVSPISNSIYQLTVIDNGCMSIDTIIVFVNGSSCTANAGSEVTICSGEKTVLNASGGLNYIWSNNSTTSQITISPTSTTTYIVTATFGTCTATDDVVVTVSNAVPIVDAGDNKTICIGTSTNLIATGAATYSWFPAIGLSQTAISNPVAIPSITTTYNVIGTSAQGCTASDEVVVAVINLSLNANAGPDVTIMPGNSVTLSATGGINYSWSTGQTIASITVAPTTVTSYVVTASNNSCSATDGVAVYFKTIHIKGNFYNDLNNNGQKEINEPYLSDMMIKINRLYGTKLNYLKYTNNGYDLYCDTGTYIIKPIVTNYYTIKPDSYIVKLSSLNSIDSLKDFGFHYVAYADLGVVISPYHGAWSTFRQGGTGVYELKYYNNGNTTMDGCIKVVKDSRITKTNKSISYDTLYYCFKNLAPNEIRTVLINFQINSAVQLGDFFITTAYFDPPVSGDNNINNNSSTFIAEGLKCYDPNDINVNKIEIPIEKVNSGDTLEYLIRFQNSGNDTAFFVRVRDSISDKLDISTLNVIACSHNYSLNIKDNRIIDFVFDNILLPDSHKTYTGSCGYIRYKISPKRNLMAGDKINNKAYIYFDYNDAVITNTAITEVKQLTVDLGYPEEICKGEKVKLKIKNIGTGVDYKWTGDNGQLITGDSITVNPAITTTYKVTATKGNITATNSIVIVVNAGSNANAGADKTINSGNSITLGATGGEKYQWSNGIQKQSMTVAPSTTTTYTVTVTSDAGCTSTDAIIVTVNGSVIANAGKDVTICKSDTVRLRATGGKYYHWSTGSRLQSIVVNPTITSIYKLTVRGITGETSSAEVKVTVKTVIVDAGPDKTLCSGSSATLTAIGTGSFKWNTGDTITSIVVSPTVLKLYTVSAIIGNCVAKDYVLVRVKNMTANAGHDKTICKGKTTDLTAFGGMSYRWTVDNGQLTDGQIVSVSPTSMTTYVVTVTSIDGCLKTDDVVVSVIKCKNDNENLAGKGYLSGSLNIYPNPFANKTNLEYIVNEAGNVEIAVYDLLGNKIEELIKEWKEEGNYNIYWSGKEFEAGIYFIEMKTNNEKILKKVVLL